MNASGIAYDVWALGVLVLAVSITVVLLHVFHGDNSDEWGRGGPTSPPPPPVDDRLIDGGRRGPAHPPRVTPPPPPVEPIHVRVIDSRTNNARPYDWTGEEP
jgi:hypothetical protein